MKLIAISINNYIGSGLCGEESSYRDNYGVKLFVGDQVCIIGFDEWDNYDESLGLGVVAKMKDCTFEIVGVHNYDPNYDVRFYKVKDWKDAVDKECISGLGIRYMEN